MDSDTWLQLFIIIVLLGVNAFFAASEIAIISIRQTKLMPLIDEGNKSAIIVKSFIDEPSKLLATIQIGITLSGFFTSAVGAQALSGGFAKTLKMLNIPFITESANVISTVIITIILAFFSLILGELVPKRIAIAKADVIALKAARIINAVAYVSTPFVKFLTVCTNFITRLFGVTAESDSDGITEEEIKLMINAAEEKGVFRETEADMINSIFELDDIAVREVMTPRTDIVSIDVNDNIDDIMDILAEEHYSRMPVYEGNTDNIVGILYIKDLIRLIKDRNSSKLNIRDIMRTPFFVSEYIKIDMLFKEMQKTKTHIAIVIDEYGGTAGLITIEDLLEEIVGNIFDEYDEEELEFSKIDDKTYIVNGKLNIRSINDELELELPEDEFDTVSGLVLSLTGKIPKVGHEVEYENIRFSIEDIKDKRISKIKICINE